MNTSFTYSNEYDPAMPIVELQLGVTRAEVKLKVNALVDSGADGTMIPLSQLQKMGIRSREKRWMRGVAGGRYKVSLYPIFLQLGSFGMYLPVVGDPLNSEAIVGRDFINHLVVTLNGLAEVVEVEL